MVVYQNVEVQFALAANEELLFFKFCAIKCLIPTVANVALSYSLTFDSVEKADEFIEACKHYISEFVGG